MGTQLVFLICIVGIAGLFYLDRDRSVRNSIGTWLPVAWFLIVGSRPVSLWFGGGRAPAGNALAATLDGDSTDAAIFGVLIVAGIIVLCSRGKRTTALLKASSPVLVYYLYCLLSTAWSPFPGPSFKRWIKCVGDLVMVLIIVTDGHPMVALRRLYSRVGFVLLPFSLVLIKCTNLGVQYDELGPHYIGVTTSKNPFGMMLYVLSIGAVWNVRALLLDKRGPNRARHLIAQGTLLGFGILLLQMAHSATCLFCFVLGSGLMIASGLRGIKNRPGRLHILCIGILLLGAVGLMFGGGTVTGAMGKTADLSGRTEIWAAAIASADSPLFGTGFESFWNKNSQKVVSILSNYSGISNLNSAHNGYLQIYLDLGWVGLSLLSFIIIGGYFRAVRVFRQNSEFGSLALTLIVTCAFYNITEAGFRIMTLSWISLLLAVIGSTGVSLGMVGAERKNIRALRSNKASGKTGKDGFRPGEQVVYRDQHTTNVI